MKDGSCMCLAECARPRAQRFERGEIMSRSRVSGCRHVAAAEDGSTPAKQTLGVSPIRTLAASGHYLASKVRHNNSNACCEVTYLNVSRSYRFSGFKTNVWGSVASAM